MNRKIFRSSFLTSILVLLCGLALITGILYQFFEKQTLNELHGEAEYLIHGVETQGLSYFDTLDSYGRRITLIDTDGTVLYDNQADVSTMENHKNREEVREAMVKGQGQSIRYSRTMTEATIYYALAMDNGQILRVAATQYSILAILLNLLRPALIVIAFAVLLSLVLSSKLTKNILRPLNNIDLDHPEKAQIYEELAPFFDRISEQSRTIERQLQEAVQKQEEFRMITENMSEGFLVIDKNTNLLTCNTAALQLLDITDKPSGSVLKLNRTKDFRDTVSAVLLGKKTEQFMTQADRTYKLIASPVYEKDEVIGSVIVILDMTESMKREALRREFTANVSHELKTPLTSISGFAELMKNGGMEDAEVRDFSTSIYDEAQRLITLVNDIIKLSSLDDDSVLYTWEDIDLFDLAGEVLSRLIQHADRKNVSLHLDGEHARICGVRQIVSEMIYNLCDNAIKYNREKGQVSVHVTGTEHHAVIKVEDNGIGIPQTDIGRVFERFYRADESHSKEVGGTGLGLSIVKHGAILHHAEIKIKSHEGQGTTVSLRFRKAVCSDR